MSQKFYSEVTLEALNNATTDTDHFLVGDSGTIKYRTGAQLLSDLGIAGIYVPYTGATGNVDLGTHTLSSYDLIVNHTSGSGVAASITKGGNGEALTINKTSGSGNAMSVTGGLTSLVDLTLSSIANATIDTDRFIVSDSGLIKYRTGAQVLSDIGGQPALTNPITGTGTTNYVSKFTGTTSLGNSQIYDNGTNVGIGTSLPSFKLDIESNNNRTRLLGTTGYVMLDVQNTGGSLYIGRDSSAGNSLISGSAAYSGVISLQGNYPLYLGTNGAIRATITGAGNVGIGTTSPAEKLDVNGNFSSNNIFLKATNSLIGTNTIDGADNKSLRLTSSNDVSVSRGSYINLYGNENASTGKIQLLAGNVTNGDIEFYTGNVIERMRITSTGNVGIGTTSPSERLSIVGATDYRTIFLERNLTANTAQRTGIVSKTYSGTNNFGLIGGADISGTSADVTIGYTGSVGANQIILYTAPTYNGGQVERIRITSTGNVGIGTTSPFSNAKLQIRPSSDVNIAFQPSNGLSSGGKINAFDDAASVNVNLELNGLNLGFKTNETERMRITSGGNVGIGVSDPISKLEVLSDLKVRNPSNSAVRFNFGWTNSNQTAYLDTYNFSTGARPDLSLQPDGGNVGIGTSSPAYPLQVNGAIVSKGGGTGGLDGTIGFGDTGTSLSGNGLLAEMYFKTGNTEKMRIDSSGNVGIGTSSPTARLESYKGSQSDTITRANAAAYFYGADIGLAIGQSASGPFGTWLQSLKYNDNVTFPLALNPAGGNVGIGTTSPSQKLDVGGAVRTASFYQISNGSTNVGFIGSQAAIFGSGGDDFTFYNGNATSNVFYTSGLERMRITSSGNVGIGTTSPGGYKLDVNGAIRVYDASLKLDFTPNSGGLRWSLSPYLAGVSNTGFQIYDETNSASRLVINSSGNVGIGTTSPSAILDVNGDALINGLTVGRGGGNSAFNTALGVGALEGNTNGEYNIAIGRSANWYSNLSGTTVIGADLFTNPSGVSELTSNSIAISQYNPNNAGTQYPHIYAPDKVNCPNGDTTTDVIAVDYSIYTAIFMEYSIFNSAGDQFRAGTYTVAFKSTGTPVDKDNQTVVYSLTTLLATFTISVTGSIATIQLRNQDTDTYDIRVTARLLMR